MPDYTLDNFDDDGEGVHQITLDIMSDESEHCFRLVWLDIDWEEAIAAVIRWHLQDLMSEDLALNIITRVCDETARAIE